MYQMTRRCRNVSGRTAFLISTYCILRSARWVLLARRGPWALCTLALTGAVAHPQAQAVTVHPSETAEAARWVSAKFGGSLQAEASPIGVTVLANHDPVQLNARAGRPLNLAGKRFGRGLYCHAPSKLVVRLPVGGKSFTAVAGVDSNEQTSGGRGSVVFVVKIADRVVYQSPLLREGMPGQGIETDLAGAREFILEVSDGGDGISCDQADWAEARVTLTDGTQLWLAELPMLDPARPPLTTDAPFSFTFDGKASAELLAEWPVQRKAEQLDSARTRHTLTWSDTRHGLEVRLVGIAYHDFPTVEWTLFFRNTGTADSPILQDIQPLDLRLGRPPGGEFVLHYHRGDLCTADSFQPFAEVLGPGTSKLIAPSGGRPTQGAFPYWNVEMAGEGMIAVLSWAGQWSARFERDAATALRIRAGQELTHFRLHPGEEVRTPMAVVQFYKGDALRAQNVWRRWMLAHNLPRPGGKLPPVQLAACSSHQYGEMIHADTQNQIQFVNRYLDEGLKLDYWWMDAGWYPCQGAWPNTGTWEVDTARFPNGLREISDHARSRGVRTIVWFEPERVAPGTWLYTQRPHWLLGGDGGQKLLNIGHPEARKWLIDHVDEVIVKQGIDLYRQDFNMDPLGYWRAADAEDRQGITEIRHVEGYLAYWDALRARHPDMLIDSCASGGRRNDLETLRRAVPLLRSDYIIEPLGNQAHTYALSMWFPYYGTGSGAIDPYLFRSVMCPSFTACFDMRKSDLDYALARKLLAQWRQVAPCFLGDYYPITPYTLAADAWIGWQFDRPETGDGFIQVFRRPDSIYRSAELKLRGLAEGKRYTITNLDTEEAVILSGRELMENGLLAEVAGRPGAGLYAYRAMD